MPLLKKLDTIQNDQYFDSSHIRSDLKSKAFKGAGATVSSQVAVYLIQMAGVIVLARVLTPDDFGLVAMVASIHVFFRMFRNLGLLDATVQREDINHKQVSTLFWINTASGLLITLLFMAMGPLIAWFYTEPRLALITVVIALDFCFGGLSTQHRGLLKRNLQMYRWAANEIAATAISFGMAVALALNGWGYWALAGRTAIFAIVQAAGSWIFCQWRPGLPDFKSGIRPLLEFGRNMLGSNFLIYFTESFDKVLIGRFFGAQSLGHYSRAYHLFLAPAHQLSVPLTSVAVATLSRLVNDAEKYRRYFLNAFTMVAFVAFPISGILTITGKDIILLLLGPQWEEAGEIFCVFGVGVGIQILYATHMWLHMSLGKTDRLVRWSIIGSIVICIFFLVGMPFGPQGIAASYIVSIHILIGPSLWYAGKPIQLSFSSIVSKTWKYYLAALFAGLICWFFFYGHVSMAAVFSSLNIFLRLILATILYTFTYLILIIIFYKNAKPIFQFIIALRDMMPTRG